MAEPKLSGQILDVEPADPRLLRAGDRALSDARGVMFNSWTKASTELRRPLAEASESIAAGIGASKLAPEGTHLLPSEAAKLEAQAHAAVSDAFANAEKQIEQGVDQALVRAQRAQLAHLDRLGVPKLPVEVRQQIQESARRDLDAEFPVGSGQNFRSRMARLQDKHSRQMTTLLHRSYREGATDKIARDVSAGLAHSTRGVRSPVVGGSAFKSMQRLLVAEETRLANAVEVRTIQASGVSYAHWRLNPTHKWYGGKEICEHLASVVDQDVARELSELGLDAGADLEGLHRVSSWPDYPHPYCKCYPEAWYPPSLRALLDNAAIVAQRVGEFPDELVAAGAISGVEVDAAVATLSALAEEAGLGIEMASMHVEALGPQGAARALAQRIRQIPGQREQVLAAVRKKLTDELPHIRDQMNKTVQRLQADLQRVSDDVMLAESTRASLKARLQAQLHREVVQNSANLESLLVLEEELAAKKLSTLTTQAFTSQKNLVRKMVDLGMNPVDYKVMQKSGQFWAEIESGSRGKLLRNVTELTPARRKRIAEIKSMTQTFEQQGSRKVLEEFSPGHRFKQFQLDKGQQAGALMIEQEKEVLLHFAPGIGKTPMAAASVNSLVEQGLVQRALISPPASVREQFLREIMKFSGDDATATLMVPKADVAKTVRSLRASIESDLRGNSSLSAEDVKRIAESRMSRIQVHGVPRGANALQEFDDLMATDKSRFLVMGHDDMADLVKVLPKHVDYVAIDEVHQLTSAVVGQGSGKAEALQELVGDRIKYKVGLTGTAVRNNVGELWDISNWLRPGTMPNKREFMASYDALTLESNMLQNSMVKALRRRIDDFVFTLPSPVEAELSNFMTDPSKLMRLEMSTSQRARAETIERQFQRLKTQQTDLPKDAKAVLEEQLTKDRDELSKLLRSRGIADPDSPAIAAIPAGEQATVESLKASIEKANRVLSPESWRDNQHFLNIHDLDGAQNAKVQRLKELLTTDLKGEKTIVHLEQMASIKSIKAELGDLRVAVYSGDMSMSTRSAIIDKFNNGEFDVILVTRAGSTGLNLQKASAATVHFDTPFTHAEYLQREARNWRRGQDRAVRSYLLHQEDHFIDRRRLEILTKKKQVLDSVDELSKLDDVVDRRLLARAATREDMKTYEKLVAEGGKEEANQLLKQLCSRLILADGEPCPFRPETLARRAERKKPVLQAASEEQRREVVERTPRRRSSTP